jgi:hypothetical protein
MAFKYYNHLENFNLAEALTTGHVAHHYTSRDELPGILRFGLQPSKTLQVTENVYGLPEFAHQKYIFSFLDNPKPEEWINNPEFPDVFDQLMGNIGSVLGLHFMFRDLMLDQHMEEDLVRVSFPVLSSDEAYVVDWAKCERHRKEGIPAHANLEYALSRTPLQDYRGQHTLPELLIANPVQPHRLKVDKQPFQGRSKIIEKYMNYEKVIKVPI